MEGKDNCGFEETEIFVEISNPKNELASKDSAVLENECKYNDASTCCIEKQDSSSETTDNSSGSVIGIQSESKRKSDFTVGDQQFEVQNKKPFSISYEWLLWIAFGFVTVLCIIDRFVMKGDIVLERGGKRVSKLWGENVGETITNIVWGITARIIITAQNMMFYTTLWCVPNFIFEHSPNFIKIIGIRDTHIRIHRIIGIFLIGIPSLAHVLVIFVPPLTDRTKLTYSPPSQFNYSSQPGNLNWTKFWDPAAIENWTFNDINGVHLTSDEIYRFTLMIALFCVIFPLSRSKMLNDRSYSLALAIHSFAGIWYAIDNIRKITHGLAHVFNLPMLIFWCVDRLLSIFLYRKHYSNIVSRQVIGQNEYIQIRLKFNENQRLQDRGIGDVFYLLKKSGTKQLCQLERSHPFTSFSNHSNDASWDIGFIITVMNDENQWCPAWTRRLCDPESVETFTSITSWGPYRSSAWHLYKELQCNNTKSFILFASGSGFGYIYDVLGVLAHKLERNHIKPKIYVHYTVRTKEIKTSFENEIEVLLAIIRQKGIADVIFHWYITGTKDGDNTEYQHDGQIIEQTGRIDFEKIISKAEKRTSVYFVGRPSIADYIEKICNKYCIDIIKDFTNSQRGTSDKYLIILYLKYTCYVMVIVVVACMFLSIYLKH